MEGKGKTERFAGDFMPFRAKEMNADCKDQLWQNLRALTSWVTVMTGKQRELREEGKASAPCAAWADLSACWHSKQRRSIPDKAREDAPRPAPPPTDSPGWCRQSRTALPGQEPRRPARPSQARRRENHRSAFGSAWEIMSVPEVLQAGREAGPAPPGSGELQQRVLPTRAPRPRRPQPRGGPRAPRRCGTNPRTAPHSRRAGVT